MINPCECCQSKLKFFKQINGNYMHSMVIPEWFANYFGGKTSGTVKLEAPDGNIYDVGVTENMNRTILKTGWAAFIDANKIEENYSLMFRHHGNARFEVTIFDSNGKEKPSCCARTKTASGVKKHRTYDVDNSSRSCGGTTRSSAGEGSDSDRSQKESSYHYKKRAKTPGISYSSEECSEDNPAVDGSVESDERQMLSDNIVLSGRCYLTEEQELKIQALVRKMRPEIPVLVVVMKKTNVKQCGNLVIRKDYALKYFPCEDTNIILQVPMKNNTWKCKFHIRPSGVSDAGRRNLSLGNFVRDNHVREGDICLFQLMSNVKQIRFTMTAHLLRKASIDHSPDRRIVIGSNHGRASTNITGVKEQPPTDGEEISSSDNEEHGDSESSEGASEPPFILPDKIRLTQAQEKKVLEKVKEIETELPIYVAIINKMNVCHRNSSPILNFGLRYATTYLEKKRATGHHGKKGVISLVLQRAGKSRTWATEMRWSMHRASHQLRVLKGWPSFSRANRMREGDLCLFKLMKSEEPLKMMVYIIRREKC